MIMINYDKRMVTHLPSSKGSQMSVHDLRQVLLQFQMVLQHFRKMENHLLQIIFYWDQQIRLDQDMKSLFEKIHKECSVSSPVVQIKKSSQEVPTSEQQLYYTEDEVMTIKHAMHEMNVCRSTIDTMRKEGNLTSLYNKRSVRLIKAEVLKLKETYSKVKGKI